MYVNFDSLFEVIVGWIKENNLELSDVFEDVDDLKEMIRYDFEIDDLFSEEEIFEFAREHEPHEVFHKETLLEWAASMMPEEIFSKEELTDWALANGMEMAEDE